MKLKIQKGDNKADRAVIGLDIGSDSIKMVRGFKTEDKIRVTDFACREYASSEATPESMSRHIHELLASVLSSKQLKASRIHSLISGKKLCIRVVKLPIMPEQEIYQAIRSKIRKYVSPDLDQVKFSFAVVGEAQEEGVKKLEVVFAAVQKSVFDEYLQLFRAAGTQPETITSSCFSEWKLIQGIGLNKGVSSLMLINLESQETDLTVYRDEQFIFTRTISLGKANFINIFKGQAQVPLDNAEELKRIWSLEAEVSSPRAAEKTSFSQTREQLHAEADVLCKEIELTVHHYYQITHGQRIDKCLILGAGSQVAGLVDYLKQKLEIPVECLYFPDAKIELEADKRGALEKDFPLYTQALGTILAAPADINLLGEVKQRAKVGIHLLKISSGFSRKLLISGVSLALAMLMFLKGVNLYYQFKIRSYEKMNERLGSQTEQLVRIKRKQDVLNFERTFYRRLIKECPSYPVIIAEILNAMPSRNMALDELKFYSDASRIAAKDSVLPLRFSIAGKIEGEDLTGAETTNFVLTLEQSGYFENISITIKDGYLSSADAAQPSKKGKRELGYIITGNVKLKD